MHALRAWSLAVGLLLVAAVPARAATPWSRPADVPGSAGAGFPFDVAAGANGVTAVAFIRDGVRVAVRDARGRWGGARRISTAGAAITSPDVEVSAAGEVVVAWTRSQRRAAPLVGMNRIEVAVRGRNGRWAPPQVVGSSQHFIAAEPRVAVNARGDAAVLWRGERAGGRDVLRAARRRAPGRFGRAESLGEAGSDQQAIVEPDGRVDAVWTHTLPPEHLHSEIRFAAATSSSGWTAPRTIHADDDTGPALAQAPDGSFAVAWRSGGSGIDPTSGGHAMAALGSRDGQFAPARTLSDAPAASVHLGITGTGEVVVAWSPPLDEVSGIAEPVIYWVARPPGGEFSTVNVANGVRAEGFAVLADGAAIAVGARGGITSAVRPPGGLFGAPLQVAPSGDFPALAVGGLTATAAWLTRGRLSISTLRP